MQLPSHVPGGPHALPPRGPRVAVPVPESSTCHPAAEEKKFRELEARMKKEEARRKALELGLEHEDEATAGAGRWHRLGLVAACRAATKRARRLWVGADPTLRDCRLAESRS